MGPAKVTYFVVQPALQAAGMGWSRWGGITTLASPVLLVAVLATALMTYSLPALLGSQALRRADQIEFAEGKVTKDYYVPIVADAEAGFGGPLNAYELTFHLIESGAAGGEVYRGCWLGMVLCRWSVTRHLWPDGKLHRLLGFVSCDAAVKVRRQRAACLGVRAGVAASDALLLAQHG